MQQRPNSSWTSVLTLTVFIVIMAGLGRGRVWRDREFRVIKHGLHDVEQYARRVEDAAGGTDETKATETRAEATETDHHRVP